MSILLFSRAEPLNKTINDFAGLGSTLSQARSAIDEARDTFSSWDKCMTRSYCKWSVIAGIILASLIVLSITICIVRCCCCGLECCCGCFACCNACCPSPRRSKQYKEKNAFIPPQPPTPQYYQPNLQQSTYPSTGPQTAIFDASREPVREDSLPLMPSWDSAQTRRVEITTSDTDIKNINSYDHISSYTPSAMSMPATVVGNGGQFGNGYQEYSTGLSQPGNYIPNMQNGGNYYKQSQGTGGGGYHESGIPMNNVDSGSIYNMGNNGIGTPQFSNSTLEPRNYTGTGIGDYTGQTYTRDQNLPSSLRIGTAHGGGGTGMITNNSSAMDNGPIYPSAFNK